MARTLILGGTRNLGHVTAEALFEAGHDVAILNRGMTPDDLPPGIERIRADRNDDASMRTALASRSFDLVLDNTTYTERDARQVTDLLEGSAGRYVFISSGQVYLVRENIERPFREEDYEGAIMPEPARQSPDHPSWLYGIDKRLAEQVIEDAHERTGFPFTTLRLPMVASERDHYGRIQGYVARMLDGAPLLVPEGRGLPLRHVYVNDVARLITQLMESDNGVGKAFNISYGSSLTHEEFMDLLADAMETDPQLLRVDRGKLEKAGLLPDCSPFSGKWMSELDNTRSLENFAIEYSPPSAYLPSIVADYRSRWAQLGLMPDSYRQRAAEIDFIKSLT
jgi:nucleoside-diphosphate-sugar epimerase